MDRDINIPLKAILRIIVASIIGFPFIVIIVLQVMQMSKQRDDNDARIWTSAQHEDYQKKQEARWQMFKRLNPNLSYPPDPVP